MGLKRPRLDGWLTGWINLAAVLLVFFAVPIGTDQSSVRLAVGLVLSVAGVCVVGRIVFRETQNPVPELRGVHLLLALEVVVVVFSFIYYTLAVNSDQQMYGIKTRLDALYFTASTMTSVGYGDIHPVGQWARGLVTLNLAFNVVFVATLAILIDRRLSRDNRGETTAT